MPTTVKGPDNDPCESRESDDERELENLDKLHLDDFELLDVQESLGKGSFGVVQKIRRKKQGGGGKIYALKSMRKAEVIDGNLVDQVELEIQVQRRLKHRNVLRLYRHFEDAETVYLLLEFCARGELYQILRTQRSRRFSEERACNFFCQASEGLMYLHSNNVVHRDIKPENLLVTNEDVLKIADFGWCAVSSTLRTTFCGTLDYLAPEMIQGKGHDHTLDIWGAGVLLYEMVVGRPPFQSTNHGQLISKILKLELHFPATLATESFKQFKELVRQLLKTDPCERLSLKAALRHPWVLNVSPKTEKIAPAGLSTPLMGPRTIPHQNPVMLASPQLRSRRLGVEEADSNDIVIRMSPGAALPVNEEEPDRERSIDRRVMTTEVSQMRVPEKVTPLVSIVPTTAQVAMPTTPAMATRGLQSPRVPSAPNHLPQPVSISRPTGAVTTSAVHPMRVSPLSTPLVVSRTLAKDTQPLQFVGASSMASDELSRTWNRMTNVPSMIPAPIVPSSPFISTRDAPGNSSAEQRALSAARQETPVQSVVYRPLMPQPSPPGACRSLDTSNLGTSYPEAPGTPGQRTAFRSRTLSPAADHRTPAADHRLGMGALAGAPAEANTTAEAVRFGISGGYPQRQGFPGRGVSVSQQQRRNASKEGGREPLHHASSQHALQRGGAQSSTGAKQDPSMLPTSPQLKPRRLTAAQPASVSTGIAGTRAVPSMARAPMTAAGVLASPYPVSSNAFRGTRPEQVMQRNPHNISLNTSLATNTTIDDDPQQSARCHQISEDGTEDSRGARRPDRPPSRSAPLGLQQQYSRPPTSLGGGGSMMRPQAMTHYPSVHSPIYSQGQSRLASGVPRVPLQYARPGMMNATR